MNEENSYNQNFDGVYCTCSRPYPDPENDDNDDMLQCVICEDWYHSKVCIHRFIYEMSILYNNVKVEIC